MTQLYAVRFSLWKRVYALPYLRTLARNIKFSQQPPQSLTYVVWGARQVSDKVQNCICMEDGFIHSAGLGSDLSPPMSQILDDKGIYFDARTPNALTDTLNSHVFTQPELERAEALRRAICNAGLTKYNLGRGPVQWQPKASVRVILVPGQVADDASVRYGSAHLHTMEALLQQVRDENKDAFIVYKPHPDVVSGNRKGLISSDYQPYDVIDQDADIVSLIEACDEVHTLSSLAGFDALLRNKKVVTYGRPFYAGWGLTTDKAAPLPFRSREVSLQGLIYASLVMYPIYWDWQTGQQTTPEAVIEQLAPLAQRPRKQVCRIERLLANGLRWFRNVTLYFLRKEYHEG